MTRFYKKLFAISASLGIFWAMYYGSWLPFIKLLAFARTSYELASSHSVQDFEVRIPQVLDLPPSFDQAFFLNSINNAIVSGIQSGVRDPTALDRVVQALDMLYEPIVQNKEKLSTVKSIYLLGRLHKLVFTKTGNTSHLFQAKRYYEMGIKLAPTRPQFLYGLLEIYTITHENEKVNEIARQIVSEWPDDNNTRQLLDASSGPRTLIHK